MIHHLDKMNVRMLRDAAKAISDLLDESKKEFHKTVPTKKTSEERERAAYLAGRTAALAEAVREIEKRAPMIITGSGAKS
jgi:malic enzyme